MRHYEIVFIVHPDQADQINGMVDRYRALVKKDGGHVHRFENWGSRKLAYPIKQTYKAHYILLNIECSAKTCKELKTTIQFNDAIIRTLLIRRDQAITEPSPMMAPPLKDGEKDERPVGSEKAEKDLEGLTKELGKTETSSVEPLAEAADAETAAPEAEKPSAEDGEAKTEAVAPKTKEEEEKPS